MCIGGEISGIRLFSLILAELVWHWGAADAHFPWSDLSTHTCSLYTISSTRSLWFGTHLSPLHSAQPGDWNEDLSVASHHALVQSVWTDGIICVTWWLFICVMNPSLNIIMKMKVGFMWHAVILDISLSLLLVGRELWFHLVHR